MPPARPKTVKAALGYFSEDANLVRAIKEIICGDLYYDDERFGLAGLEGYTSEEDLKIQLTVHLGTSGKGLAGAVARVLWPQVAEWKMAPPAFVPVSRIAHVSLLLCPSRPGRVVSASTCRPNVCRRSLLSRRP